MARVAQAGVPSLSVSPPSFERGVGEAGGLLCCVPPHRPSVSAGRAEFLPDGWNAGFPGRMECAE